MTVITEVEKKKEQVMAVEIWMGEEKWRIVDVYGKGDIEKKLKVMKKWLKEQEEDRWTIIGGGFQREDRNVEGERRGGGNRKKDERWKDKWRGKEISRKVGESWGWEF